MKINLLPLLVLSRWGFTCFFPLDTKVLASEPRIGFVSLLGAISLISLKYAVFINYQTPPSHLGVSIDVDANACPEAAKGLQMKTVYSCDYCGKTFGRSAHLERHRNIHIGQKKYQCNTCSKSFDRRDTLSRHIATHNYTEQPFVQLDGTRNPRPRACISCAKDRVRCSKGRPCLRCRTKSISCKYADTSHGITIPSSNSGESETMFMETDWNDEFATQDQHQAPGSPRQSILLPSPTTTGDAFADPVQEHQIIGGPDSIASLLSGSNKPLDSHSQHAGEVSYDMQSQSESPTIERSSGRPLNSILTLDTQSGHLMDAALETTYNWIPIDMDMIVDYKNIIGLGTGLIDTCDQMNSAFSIEEAQQARYASVIQDETTLSTLDSTDSTISSVNTGATITHPVQIQSVLDRDWRDRYGALYADCSGGARLAASTNFGRGKDQPKSLDKTDLASKSGPSTEDLLLQTLVTEPFLEDRASWGSLDLLDAKTYSRIQKEYTELAGSPFLTRGCANYFVFLYFEHFHDSFPILHKPTLRLEDEWLLTLAIMSIGCQYSKRSSLVSCIRQMQVFLEKVIFQHLNNNASRELELPILQAIILQNIASVYNRDLSCNPILVNSKSILDPIWQRSMFLNQSHTQGKETQPESWSGWVLRESWVRLRYAIWLLDGMKAYTFGCEPLFDLEVANDPLPNDHAWKANTEAKWVTYTRGSCQFYTLQNYFYPANESGNPSLATAVRYFIERKSLNVRTSHFSQILILHGLYSELRNIGRYVVRQLPQNLHDLSSRGAPSIWLPSIGAYGRWRDNACDCLDTLHRGVNGQTAVAGGLEAPIVPQLHMARIVLLTPHEHIRLLAASATIPREVEFHEGRWASKMTTAEQEVIKWAQQDEHKARLAVMHAASFYWHVERFSIQAFYEPVILFLTTLTIWAYVSYIPSSSKKPAVVDSRDLNFIHLDRPCDDEMIQYWIRSGHPNTIKPFIRDVGNIFEPEAPKRILEKGCNLLGDFLPVWKIAGEYISELRNLIRMITENEAKASA